MFDATNTTRERRDMILNFAKQNAFKVGSDSVLEEERSGGWGRGGEIGVEPVSLLSSGFGYQSLSPQGVCLVLECFLFRSFL